MKLNGQLVQGYRVASGLSTRDTRFPGGTIKMQAPFFAAQGFDINDYFKGKHFWGSLNVDIAPFAYKHVKNDYFFSMVHWTPLQAPENFFLSKATVTHKGQQYKGLVYTPDPSTKPNHFQYPNIVEVIAEKIDGIAYGDAITFEVPDDHFELTPIPPR